MKRTLPILIAIIVLGCWLTQSREKEKPSRLRHDPLPLGILSTPAGLPTYYAVSTCASPALQQESISTTATLPDPIDELLIRTIITIESSGNPTAQGAHGERGLMQLRPAAWKEATTRRYGTALPFDQAWNPETNREAGEAYLRILLKRLRVQEAEWNAPLIPLLLASYNAGSSGVARHGYEIKRMPSSVQSYVKRASTIYRQARIEAITSRKLLSAKE